MDPAPIAPVSLFINPIAEVLSLINPDSAAAGAPRAANSGGLGGDPSNGASVVVPSKLGNGGIVLTPSQLKNDGSVSVDEIQLPASTQDAMVNTTMGLSMVGSSDTMCRSGVSAPMPGGAIEACRRVGPKARQSRTSNGQLDPNKVRSDQRAVSEFIRFYLEIQTRKNSLLRIHPFFYGDTDKVDNNSFFV